MVGRRVTTRLSGPRAFRVGALLAAGFLTGVACGCSTREKALAAIEGEYARGNYEETVALCEGAIRGNAADADVFRFYGLSLLGLERDVEGFDQLRKAVSMNSALTAGVSASVAAEARESLALGKTSQAAGRLRVAVELDPAVDVGPLAYLVAESFFEERRWEEAARRYESALGARPDTSAAEKGYFNLALCHAALGDSASAMDVLEGQLAAFPRGALAGQARWTLVQMLFDRARSEYRRGNYSGAVVLATDIVRRADSGLAQRARFLLGESFERMGDYASAYEQYEAIVGGERGVSGKLVERARAKIRAMHEAGLR